MKFKLFVASLLVFFLALGSSFSVSARHGHKHYCKHCSRCYGHSERYDHYHSYRRHHHHSYDRYHHHCCDNCEGNRHRHYSHHSRRW